MTDFSAQYLANEPMDPEEAQYQRDLAAARAQAKVDNAKTFLTQMTGPVPTKAAINWMLDLQDAPNNLIGGVVDAAINAYDTVGELVDMAVPPETQAAVQQTIAPSPEKPAGPSPFRDVLVSLRDASRRNLSQDTVADDFVRQTVQFMVPFTMATKAMGGFKTGATVANVAKGAAAEAATMFGAFDPHAGRFADLLQAVSPDGLAANRFIDYLTSRENEGEMEGRFKNVVDSLAGSAAVGAAIKVGATTFKGAARQFTKAPPPAAAPE